MRVRHLSKIAISLALVVSSNLYAQNSKEYIYLSGTRFTYPIIEKWITEYRKVNPTAKIKLQYSKLKSDSTNLKVVANNIASNDLKSGEQFFRVNRYALLPIANERNLEFKKAFKKGLKQQDLRKIFFNDPNSIFEEAEVKKPSYTIYTQANLANSSIAFANHFGQLPTGFKGKKISGDDQYLTLAVQKDTTGVTYNNLGYIFDVNNRLPVKGIKVVPIDLNENGKIDKDEQIYDNLDVLTSYIENHQESKAIPIEYISFVVNKNNNNLAVQKFVNWVLTEGQKYNHTFGFLNNDNSTKTISQNL
ncbi:MAG: hypothetical protein Q8928_17110 [Bacteroidota bacterium]|nr:hypothetical protein [Bacteroidota bacterium]